MVKTSFLLIFSIKKIPSKEFRFSREFCGRTVIVDQNEREDACGNFHVSVGHDGGIRISSFNIDSIHEWSCCQFWNVKGVQLDMIVEFGKKARKWNISWIGGTTRCLAWRTPINCPPQTHFKVGSVYSPRWYRTAMSWTEECEHSWSMLENWCSTFDLLKSDESNEQNDFTFAGTMRRYALNLCGPSVILST